MALRSIQGMTQGLLEWIKSPLPVPHYTCLCKRMPELKDCLPKLSARRPSVLIVDSSGLKSFGPEEWLRFRHQIKTKSRWIKVHISLDPASQEVISYEVTHSSGSDVKALPALLEGCPRSVQTVIADGVYDTKSRRAAIACRNAQALIRPKKSSIISLDAYPGKEDRDESVRAIKGLGNDSLALSLWRKLTRYGRRSLVETPFLS